MKYVTLAVATIALSTGVSGCAKARAAGVLEGPPLAMPAPPPRELGPVEAALLATAMTGPDAPLAAAPRISPAPLPPRRQPIARPDVDARTEAPPAAASATPVVGPAEPARELRVVPPSAPTADTSALEKKVQTLLNQAAADLRRVDYGKLSAVSKQNYDESKRYSEEAAKKLKERNVTQAQSAAEKAANLAAFLTR